VKQIDRALYNPIWSHLRKPAPWDAREAAARDMNALTAESHAANAPNPPAQPIGTDAGMMQELPA
jgi:nitrogenase molybdenum-cofactor synthesis protein NifE